MEHVTPEAALEHARTVRTAQKEALKAATGDTLYPPVAEPASHHAAAASSDDKDRLVPDPGDVKAATANPHFGEAGGATPAEGATTHATPSTGSDVHK